MPQAERGVQAAAEASTGGASSGLCALLEPTRC